MKSVCKNGGVFLQGTYGAGGQVSRGVSSSSFTPSGSLTAGSGLPTLLTSGAGTVDSGHALTTRFYLTVLLNTSLLFCYITLVWSSTWRKQGDSSGVRAGWCCQCSRCISLCSACLEEIIHKEAPSMEKFRKDLISFY